MSTGPQPPRKCGRCGMSAPFLFVQPGPRSQRTDPTVIAACGEHRDDARAAWAKRYGIKDKTS